MSFQTNNPVSLFDQHLWEESITQKHALGTIRALSDGRVFAYAKAGGTGLAAGKLNQSEAVQANYINEPVIVAAAIGATSVNITPGATAIDAGEYSEGYLWHNKTSVLGQMYKISGHVANAGSVNFDVDLSDPIRVALTTSDEVSLMKHPQRDVIIHPTTETSAAAGVAPIAVTADYYFWHQVKGPCAVLAHGTLVLGNNVTPSIANTPVAGAVEASTEAVSIAAIVGTVLAIGTTAETAFINLAIPGY